MALRGPARAAAARSSFAPLKKLLEPEDSDLEAGFQRLAELLQASGETADVQFDIAEGRRTHRWHVALREKSATVGEEAARRPDVRLIVGDKTWRQIAAGQLSPLDAFLSGQLRFRGDVETATRLFKKVAGRGVTEIPLARRR
jgi:putative sterol carrier protein